jgi:PadR family transcriptional regulator PadR
MRRKQGVLLLIEIDILRASVAESSSGDGWLHGYALAKRLAEGRGSSRLTAHGTLYKALARMVEAGLLENQWEDPDLSLAEGRPRRRLYRITGLGQRVLSDAEARMVTGRGEASPRIAPA